MPCGTAVPGVAVAGWLSLLLSAAMTVPGIAACPWVATPCAGEACEPGTLAVPPASWLSVLADWLAVLSALTTSPLLMKPTTPSVASEPLYWWALTEKLGSESPPIVSSVPWAYFVTTSTWPLNSTQSPGCGW